VVSIVALNANHARSWETAYAALCDPETAAKSASLHIFLHDAGNLQTLSNPWKPFPEPSAQEKTKYESKTAPISVTPAPNSGYSIEEIKADALWLSKLVNISEFAALRLVIIEWQSRPTVQLLSGLTEEEALSVHDAAGLSNLGASTFVPNSSIITAPSSLGDAQFESGEQRKLRLVQTYLTTRISILRASQLLIAWGAAKSLRQVDTYGQDYRVCDDWLEQLGQDIASRQGGQGLDSCIHAIKHRWTALTNGFTWEVSETESIQEAAAELWMTAQVTEVVHILHVAFVHADLLATKFVPATTIELWFKTAAEMDFFSNLALVSPKPPISHTLVNMINNFSG
jgi:nuclear pore complex protein Nup188